jgi:uncharacterized membrane protein
MTLRQERLSAGSVPPGWRDGPVPGRGRPVAWQLSGLVLIGVLTGLHGLWAVQVLLVVLLLVVPGVVLLRALRVPGEVVAAHPAYVPAASLLVLTGSGLAVDVVGLQVGISAPLRTVPLLVGLEVVCGALVACSVNAPAETQIPWDSLSRPARLAWPLLLPLAAAAGAVRLNSGHGNQVAVIAVIAVIAVLIAGFLFAPWLDEPLLAVIIFATALAMLWSFSLRGDSVYGFDIASEYYSLHQTVVTGAWHFPHPNDAYSAMLSLTVLPADLHALSGMQDLLVFKVLYPVIGAFFPVAVYTLARRVLASYWAFLAAALVVMQSTFFQEFPALARQEAATLLFAALITAVLDTRSPRRTRWAWVVLLSLGMVVFHYSTAYLAIALLAIAVVVQWVVSWFRPVPRVTGTVLLACVVSAAGAAVWYGSLTQSTSNMSQFATAAKGQGIDLLPNSSGGSLVSRYLAGEESQVLTPVQYQKYISAYYQANDPFVTPLPDASQPRYALQSASDPSPAVRWKLGNDVIQLGGLLVQQLTNLLAGLGALALALRRRLPPMARHTGLLSLGAMVILVLTRLSGTVAEFYNPQRAFLQLLIVLGVAVCWVPQRTGARWKPARPVILTACAVGLAVSLGGQSTLSGALLGGGTTANLANRYDDYQQFVMTAPELASAAWVTGMAPPDQLIYADRYAQLRLQIVAGNRNGVLGDITPETLDQHAWVYADRTNTAEGITRSVTGNYESEYAFPNLFLDSNFDVVYTNGTSEVFHR